MAVRGRRRREWRPVVAVAAVAVVGWVVLLRTSPVVAWLLFAAAVVVLAWSVRRRVAGDGPRRMPSARSRRKAAGGAGGGSSPRGGGAATRASPRASGAGLEREVAELLERDGCEDVRISGGAGDRGADLRAISPRGHSVVVQCKAYRGHPVGDPAMQTFLGTVRQVHNAETPLFVTTSRFTAPARRLAREHGVVLVDGQELARWRAGTSPLPDEPTEFVGRIRDG